MTEKTLDDIIDEHQRIEISQQELYDHYGGCECAIWGRMAPCGFCENYDWENDPFNIL
jgi:hypothetical protein